MFCTDDHIPLHHVGIFTVIFQQTVTRMSFLSYPHDTVGLQVTGRVNTRFILIIRLMLNHKVQRRPQRLNNAAVHSPCTELSNISALIELLSPVARCG